MKTPRFYFSPLAKQRTGHYLGNPFQVINTNVKNKVDDLMFVRGLTTYNITEVWRCE